MARRGLGLNCTLNTDGSGLYRVRCTRLLLPVSISSSSGESQTRTAFYPSNTTHSSFTMEVIFPSWESREDFNTWAKNFMARTVAGRGFRAAVRVDVPARKFVRDAVPTGPLLYGEAICDQAYTMSLSFVGASDPLDINLTNRKARAYFVLPSKERGIAKNFYPSTKQLSGADSLDGSLFDNQPRSGGSGGFIGGDIPKDVAEEKKADFLEDLVSGRTMTPAERE